MQHLSNNIMIASSNITSILYMDRNNISTRITLRKLSTKDLPQFYTWASDPDVAKTMTWEAYTSTNEAEKFLNDIVEKHPWFMAICLDGIPIGSITLTPGKGSASCKAELGYVVAKEYWGHGIATEAVKLALKQGFKELQVSRIEAFVDPDNLASQRVLIKAGLICEGLLRNYIYFKGFPRDRYIYSAV